MKATRLPDPFWASCDRCGLSRTRRTVVLGRGSVPADVMFVGIGPGVGEDVVGKPFIGPSGQLLDAAIADASARAKWEPRCYFDNLVACRPTDDRRGENRDPSEEEATCCRPRLVKAVELCRPRRIILLGLAVQGEVARLFPDADELPHPASVLYSAGNDHGSVHYRRYWMALWAILEKLKKEVGE